MSFPTAPGASEERRGAPADLRRGHVQLGKTPAFALADELIAERSNTNGLYE
jgi:hypothetical protein